MPAVQMPPSEQQLSNSPDELLMSNPDDFALTGEMLDMPTSINWVRLPQFSTLMM